MDTVVERAIDLTPVETRNGRLYKREDLHRGPYGVNGSKFRVCRHLITRAWLEGHTHVVSASSVLSPQAAMAAVVAEELGMECTLVLGATSPETAIRHPSVAIAVEAGAKLDTTTRVAFNPALQPAGRKIAERLGAWQLPYGITTPAEAPPEAVEAFLAVGGSQVVNLPPETRTLVVAFGSGNTAAGILYGLATHGMPRDFERLVLVGVGPNRQAWLAERLRYVGIGEEVVGEFPFEIDHMSLHGWFADYGDKMPETVDDIVLHPTYEGKLARFLNQIGPDWWTRRDGTTCFWIVGGPI